MSEKPKPGFAPLYCGMYPGLAEEVRKFGYALAIHGSLRNDFDLIAIPWVENPSAPAEVVAHLAKEFDLTPLRGLTEKPHGRLVQTMAISFGQCYLDLSFMPIVARAQ
jgi:hypothetical protein